MISVKVGQLRNHLSKYLRRVRNGAEVVITDRDTPIGRLVPYRSDLEEESFEIEEPPNGFEQLAGLSFADLPCAVDPVDALLEDRRRR